MDTAKKSFQKLDCKEHPAEADLLQMTVDADLKAGEVVKEARKLGMTWPALLALMLEYGPLFVSVLRAIIDAIKTPPPSPSPSPHAAHSPAHAPQDAGARHEQEKNKPRHEQEENERLRRERLAERADSR